MEILSHAYSLCNLFTSSIHWILATTRNLIYRVIHGVIYGLSRNVSGSFTGNFTGNANGGAPFIMLVFICAIALMLLLPAVNDM